MDVEKRCPICLTPCEDSFCSEMCRVQYKFNMTIPERHAVFIASLTPEQLAQYNEVWEYTRWIDKELWALHLQAHFLKVSGNGHEIQKRIHDFCMKTPVSTIEPLMEWNDQGMALHAEIEADIKRQRVAQGKAA